MKRVRIDQDTITFRELAMIEEELGEPLTRLFETSQARATAALLWITLRRDDPTFTYEQAMDLGPAALVQADADPEVRSGAAGELPPSSRAPGPLIPSA